MSKMENIICEKILDDVRKTDIFDDERKVEIGEGWLYKNKRGTMAVAYDPKKKEILIHMKGKNEKDGVSYYFKPDKAQLLAIMIQKSVIDFVEGSDGKS